MNFAQEFNAVFNDRFSNLELKDVVVNKAQGTCTITFLSLSNTKEIETSEKQEIIDWVNNTLKLEHLKIKVKFMRVYLEERLILKTLQNFFMQKYKLITAYLSDESFDIKINTFDVSIVVNLSSRMTEFFAEHKIAAELSKHLKENFLVDFTVTTQENAGLLDEVDIENVEIKTSYRPAPRFKVEIVKEVIGKKIPANPEYLSNIKKPKEIAIVAGFINKLERKEFIQKKGKNAGDPKAFYTFQLEDDKSKIDCVYFCAKTNERVMDKLEDFMYVLLQGEVKLNYIGKLSLNVKKIALASKIEKEVEEDSVSENQNVGTSVVQIEKLISIEQDDMFSNPNLNVSYNDKIMGKTIVVFDIETTGFDFENDQITEIGAVKIVDGEIKEKFSTFVKTTIPIPAEVVKLTGITDEMVKDAPPAELVIRDFYNFTRDCVLSGHNVIDFDIKFIRKVGRDIGLNFDNEMIDTLNEARMAKLGTKNHKLGTVVKALGLTLEGAHRAWNDAYATAQVLLKLNEINKKD